MEDSREYSAPVVRSMGSVRELTANDGVPRFVDVPQGTPVGGTIVGSDPNPSMS